MREGARLALPIAVAALAFGAAFGVLARAAGMGVAAPLVMSATTFAGSAQLAVVSLLDHGGGVAAAVTAAVLLNARYVPIGISVGTAFTAPRPLRLLQAQLIVDESWALAARRRGQLGVLLGAGLVLYGAWNGGTALGVLGGSLLGEPERLGLDAAFPALFLALLVGQLRGRRPVTAAVAGAAIAFALIPFVPRGLPIVGAAAAALLGCPRR